MATIRIAVNGAAGRMGRRIVALGTADESLELAAALEAPDHPQLGCDAGRLAGVGELGVLVTDRLRGEVDAVIDFSTAAGAESITAACLERRTPLVMGTTGLSSSQMEQIRCAAEAIPIVYAPNTSLAVNVAMKLAAHAARALRDCTAGADVEIIERHHRYKEDAPSGTALRFGAIIAQIMGQTEHRHGRQGQTGRRPPREIGYHAVRAGDNPGEHAIIFGLLGESIELMVRATDHDCYARGALAAVKFVVRQSPGLYEMDSVLGL